MTNLIEQAIIAHWGTRCKEYEPGCPICDAWAEYDAMKALSGEAVKMLNEAQQEYNQASNLQIFRYAQLLIRTGNYRTVLEKIGRGNLSIQDAMAEARYTLVYHKQPAIGLLDKVLDVICNDESKDTI